MAIETQNPDALEALLKADPGLAKEYNGAYTYLHIASSLPTPPTLSASQIQIRILTLLYEYGAGINTYSCDNDSWTALVLAVHARNVPIIRFLLDHVADRACQVGIPHSDPLIAALTEGDLDVLGALLEDGQGTGYYGELLHAACYLGFKATIAFMLGKKCFKDALEYRHPVPVNPWLEFGYPRGQTALLCAVWGGTGEIAVSEEERRDAIRLLVEAGADLTARQDDGRSVFAGAARCGCLDIVERMLKEGHGLLDDTRDNTLVDAPEKELIDDYVDTRASALHFAAEGRHPKMVELLLEHGAEINGRDIWGRSPLHYALAERYIDGGMMIQDDLPRTLEMIDQLLRHGADVNAMDDEKMTALHLATTMEGTLPLIKRLVENGAYINTRAARKDHDPDYQTPLISACCCLHKTECLEYLLSKGADPNIIGDEGRTVLFQACQSGDQQMGDERKVKLLIKFGAHVDVADAMGRTTLMAAARAGSIDCQQALLEAGASEALVDNSGRTAADFQRIYRGKEERRLGALRGV